MKTSIIKIILIFFALYNFTFAQWVPVNSGMGSQSVWYLAVKGDTIFAGTEFNGIYKSTDNGGNWTPTSLNNREIRNIAVNGIYIFAGTYLNGVYRTTDNGTTWTQVGLIGLTVNALAAYGNYVFAGTQFNGVYKSTDNGTTWNPTLLNIGWFNALAVSGNYIFAGNFNGLGVYKSTDNGTTWPQTPLDNQQVAGLAANGDNVFAGTSTGVWLSTNYGGNWTQTSLPNNQGVIALAINGNNVFAGTYTFAGVYVSTNNGGSWTQWNVGLGNLSVYSFCILNTFIFAGTQYNSVYRRPLVEVGIQPISSEIPKDFSLSQNYPNPFNPATKMRFSLPLPSKGGVQTVKLVVFDILGQEAATLVNEQLNPGTYEVEWNASNYASGVYYYRLVAEGYSDTKKMILIK